MDLEETCIYLAVTRANAVWRVPLTSKGNATKVGVFVQLSGGSGPDGLALDADGGLVIAHVGLGSIWITDRYGEITTRIKAGAHRHTTYITFGGSDGPTFFITESDPATNLKDNVLLPAECSVGNECVSTWSTRGSVKI